MKNLYFYLCCLLFVGLSHCNEKENIPTPQTSGKSNAPESEVSIIKLQEVSANDLSKMAVANGYALLAYKIKYDLTVAKIIYKTNYKGVKINASGMIYLPRGTNDSLSLLCFNHGTIFLKSDAPTESSESSGAMYLASTGFITVLPDYIGYGSSSQIFHPYFDEQYSASAVIDIINAGRTVSANEKITLTRKVFIAGYSQGGYVTMATQKAIEQNPDNRWKLAAVAAGAGAFDLKEFLKTTLTGNQYSCPSNLAFIVESYNNTYDWNKPSEYFFSPTFAATVPQLLNGTYSGGYIDNALTSKVDLLFNDSFYVHLKGNTEPLFTNAIEKNSLTDWKSTIPLRIYHGTADKEVSFNNSKSTYEQLLNNGSINIEFKTIPGGTHTSSVTPMLLDSYAWFAEMNKN